MKPIIGISILLILVILGLAMGFVAGFFGISLLIFFFSGTYAIFVFTFYVIWKILPQDIRRKYKQHKIRFGAILLTYIAFFLFVGWMINHYFLPYKFHPVSILFNVYLLFFLIFLGWCLLKSNRVKVIATFLLFIAIPGFLIFHNMAVDGPPVQTLKDEDKHALEQLRALPYISWSSGKAEPTKSGVVKYDRKRAFPGYNLYTDDRENAFLMDMSGEKIYRWRFPLIKGKWEYVELLDKGEIVAICVGKCIVKLDRDSEIIWIRYYPVHHDIEISPDGTYFVPSSKPYVLYNLRKVKFDAILHLSEAGDILSEWRTFPNLDKLQKLHSSLPLDLKPDTANVLEKAYFSVMDVRDRVKKKKSNGSYSSQSHALCALLSFIKRIDRYIINRTFGLKKTYDYYHLNTVEVLPETELGTKDKRFQAGNYLICLRNADLILILDKNTMEIVWSWGPGILDWPHMPTMIPDGNILIFDNGVHRAYSRLIEINPATGRIVWEYKADIPGNFYSKWRGSNQRLLNGNTLICESENGRVFEVTREGEIVWEFFNPEIKDEKRQLIYRMLRVAEEKVESWLKLPQ